MGKLVAIAYLVEEVGVEFLPMAYFADSSNCMAFGFELVAVGMADSASYLDYIVLVEDMVIVLAFDYIIASIQGKAEHINLVELVEDMQAVVEEVMPFVAS